MGGWIVFLIQARYGLGKHQSTISPADNIIFQHAGFWQSVISATLALGFLKISIGLNLLRLSLGRWYNWALWCTMGMAALLLYSFFSYLLIQVDLTIFLSSFRLLLYLHGPDDLLPPLHPDVRCLGHDDQVAVL